MSDLTRNLIDAIISGKATDIEITFQASMAEKISSAMEDKKIEVAQGMFTKEEYSEKNPKIDLYHKDSGDYLASTNFSPTVKHAVAGYEVKNPDMVGKVKGSKATK